MEVVSKAHGTRGMWNGIRCHVPQELTLSRWYCRDCLFLHLMNKFPLTLAPYSYGDTDMAWTHFIQLSGLLFSNLSIEMNIHLLIIYRYQKYIFSRSQIEMLLHIVIHWALAFMGYPYIYLFICRFPSTHSIHGVENVDLIGWVVNGRLTVCLGHWTGINLQLQWTFVRSYLMFDGLSDFTWWDGMKYDRT